MAAKSTQKLIEPIAGEIDTAHLFGDRQRYLERIGQRVGVTVATEQKDGQTSVVITGGNAGKRRMARDIVREMAGRIANERAIDDTAVDAIIKKLSSPASESAPATHKPHVAGPFNKAALTMRNKKIVEPRNQSQADYMEQIRDNEVIFGIGPAGTGKTYLAIAAAVHAFENDSAIKKIILVRPAVEAGEKLGFLPGDLKEKIDPYMQPLYDALYDMKDKNSVTNLIKDGTIEIAPLAYMRGRTLRDAIVILDEAQNTTVEQMKMFLTRMGEGSKLIITGDDSQIDLPKDIESGLIYALRTLDDVEGLAIHKFNSSDVVRHHMVARMVQAFERHQP